MWCYIVFFIHPPNRKATEAIHRAAITPTCFRRYRDIAVQFLFLLYDCNLELLVEPPSKENYRKVPLRRAQKSMKARQEAYDGLQRKFSFLIKLKTMSNFIQTLKFKQVQNRYFNIIHMIWRSQKPCIKLNSFNN